MKKILAFALLLVSGYAWTQSYEYTLDWENPSSHRFDISMATEPADGEWTVFQLPAWRPGRYIVQNYAAGVTNFMAASSSEESLEVVKRDKDSWAVRNPESGKIYVYYSFYANVIDAGSSYLGPEEVYFNGSNLFMHVKDRLEAPCTLDVMNISSEWKAATALKQLDFNTFAAESYHDFIDAPTILSPDLKTLKDEIDGVTYNYHFQGKFKGDEEVDAAIKTGIKKIIREQTAVFGEVPLKEYHFIYYLLPYNMRHAVEHKYSSMYTLPEGVVANVNALKGGLFGITSHEFWHLWNVKRIRPAALWPYDYSEPQYTSLHWFTEGVTSYYEDLTMVRNGIWSRDDFFNGLGGTIETIENDPASVVTSPALSSLDSWLAGSAYQDPSSSISYYTLGQRVGLLLDLRIRAVSDGSKSLDDLFKYLYENYYKKGKGVPEDGVQKAAETLTGESFEEFFRDHVHGTAPVNYKQYFHPFGLELRFNEVEGAGFKAIGIDRREDLPYGLYLYKVRPGSDAEKAGIGDKDILVAVNGENATEMDEGAFIDGLSPGDKFNVSLMSGGKMREVEVVFTGNDIPKDYSLVRMDKITKDQEARLNAWLKSKAGY